MRIAFDTPTKIPGNISGTRKKLVFRNTGSNTFLFSHDPADTDGIPLAAGSTVPFGETMVFDAGEQRLNQPIYLRPATPNQACIVAWDEVA